MEFIIKKSIGIFDIFCFTSGAMISSGIFVLPSIVFSLSGPAVILAYILAILLVMPTVFSSIELTTAMPKSGGTYFFIYRSFGPLFGTFAGLADFFSISLKASFALVGITIFIKPFFNNLNLSYIKLFAIIITLYFTYLNLKSVKHSSKAQNYMVIFLFISLIFFIIIGLENIHIKNFVPFRPYGISNIFTAAAMIFISFAGITKSAAYSEEVKNPKKTIVFGLLTSFFTVSFLYILIVFVLVGGLEKAEFINSLLPISDAAMKFSGNFGYILLSIAGMIAFVTTANAGILAASRSPFAMSKDDLLPSFFSKLNKNSMPYISIIFTTTFMLLVLIFLNLESVVKAASTMNILLYIFMNIAVILMRQSKIISYKPYFYSPFYPYIQIFAIISYFFLIYAMGKTAILITALFFIFSILWYIFYNKNRVFSQSALTVLVSRIKSKELETNDLSDELRNILLERDEIEEDNFDKLVKKASIYDVNESIARKELFDIIAKDISTKISRDKKCIYDLLVRREEETTTVLKKGLAIPHIIIGGEEIFELTIIRAKNGILFGHDIPEVNVVFALIGSKDQRTFHLETLMNIAQIIQEKDFFKKWELAESTNELRNLILTSKRLRKKKKE